LGHGEGAPGRVAPGQPLPKCERLGVGNAAALIALKPRALAARHRVELGDRKDQKCAVLPITATWSPAAATISAAVAGAATLRTALPLRVEDRSSSSPTMKPLPSLDAMRRFAPA